MAVSCSDLVVAADAETPALLLLDHLGLCKEQGWGRCRNPVTTRSCHAFIVLGGPEHYSCGVHGGRETFHVYLCRQLWTVSAAPAAGGLNSQHLRGTVARLTPKPGSLSQSSLAGHCGRVIASPITLEQATWCTVDAAPPCT